MLHNYFHNPLIIGLVSIHALAFTFSGRSYAISSQRMLIQCIDSLVQKIQCGVVLHFEKTGPDPPPVTPGPASETLPSKDGAFTSSQYHCRIGMALFFTFINGTA